MIMDNYNASLVDILSREIAFWVYISRKRKRVLIHPHSLPYVGISLRMTFVLRSSPISCQKGFIGIELN